VLGDRIAVMAAGKLVAAGTPSFLKEKFGTGYTLTVSKKQGCQTKKVLDLVQTHVDESGIKTDMCVKSPRDFSLYAIFSA
jgi:ABC-type multidrug transport system ATPase subunit